MCCSPAFPSPVLPRVVRAVTDSCACALELSSRTGIAELIIVFVGDLFTDIGCGLFLELYKHSPGFPPIPQRQGPGQAPFCYASVLVPVELRRFWSPSFRKPSSVCLCGHAERLAYAQVIFRSDICLTQRVVSVWGSLLGPMVQG